VGSSGCFAVLLMCLTQSNTSLSRRDSIILHLTELSHSTLRSRYDATPESL